MRADIFCRVVDNYGDIGVCWRLARRLAHDHGWSLRLWVDDLHAFARIQPGIRFESSRQIFQDIDIVHWSDSVDPALAARDVVIEAFACDPPAAFIHTLQQARSLWINLEYLSAEPWVDRFHQQPSLRPDGLRKYFFFPGFTPATGGLIREPKLSIERNALQASTDAQQSFLRQLGLADTQLSRKRNGSRLVSLFCYPNAPLAALADVLAANAHDTMVIAPEGIAPELEAVWAAHTLPPPVRLPFVSQPDFDRLLWCADLNIVRGEDSLVRGIWAARPLIWHIYPQSDQAHLTKLNAWLTHYPANTDIRAAIQAWNTPAPSPVTQAALNKAFTPHHWENWASAAATWDAHLATHPDLADNLVAFCTDLSKKR